MPLSKQNPDNSGSQIPNVTPQGIHRFSHAICPNKESITTRPSHVIINGSGSFGFQYDSTLSSTAASSYITGSVRGGTPGGPVKLEINPCAWRRTDSAGSEGDVTFVYVRVR